MHIKQVILSGFRSFKSQSEIEPFSSGCNTIVGRNGSGKSNFFDAIQFTLLAPKFAVLRQEERAGLLHEGSGNAVMSAFCEIVFDNSDGRLSVDGDEVVLRRTIGLKKDEFFLNRKRVNKNEVHSLLESAGFSKANPYYIVQQGKVNALCMMSDSERLNLLKEVAGTTVYDEKRADSLAQMTENEGHRKKIDEVIEYIEERLGDLESEKKELTQYQTLDKDRRALEYTLYDKELRRAREALDELEHLRSAEGEKADEMFEEARKVQDKIMSIERKVKQSQGAQRRADADLDSLVMELTTSVTRRVQLELEVNDLKVQSTSDVESQKTMKLTLVKVETEITNAKNTLNNTVQPAYDEAKREVEEVKSRKDNCFEEIRLIYAKQGRGGEFDTVKERDEFLEGMLEEIKGVVGEKKATIAGLEDSLAALRRNIASESASVLQTTADVTKKQQLLSKLSSQLASKATERNAHAEERRERWRAMEEVSDKLSEEKEALKRANADLKKSMPRATSMGLDALKKIVEEEDIDGYYGTIVDNFTLVDEKFLTAVEVAAGNALFHVIVDTDATAAALMHRLERDKLGRVTFMPLNKLRSATNVAYPDSTDVVSISQRCIKYDSKVGAAMNMVFGRKLLAKNLDAASVWARGADMDAVTMDGDEVSRKGGLQGGFKDQAKSKLRAHEAVERCRGRVDKMEKQLKDMQVKATTLDQTIANLMTDLQKLEAKKSNLLHILSQTSLETTNKKARAETRVLQADAQAEQLPTMRSDVAGLELQVSRLSEEIGTPLSATLSVSERAALSELQKNLKAYDSELEAKSAALEAKADEREKLLSLLKDNLCRRKTELEDSLNAAPTGTVSSADGGSTSTVTVGQEISERKERLEAYIQDLDLAERAETAAEQRVSEAKEASNEAKDTMAKAKTQIEELKATEVSNTQTLQAASDKAENLLNKRSMCVSKRELYMRKIQELGSLPSGSISEHADLQIKDLMKALDVCNKSMKQYSHVNKKAYDQYVNFDDQREHLLTRKKELDVGAKKVKELVESLDRQKDEAINRTFRGVAAHFKEVFKELVEDGEGELVMTTKGEGEGENEDDNSDDDDSDDQNKEKENDFSLFKGVKISVKFAASGTNQIMSQLSGGQKTLVAIALIFAIQRCDPAPFVIFDEIDANVDSTYRASIASLIQRQANSEENPTQFICSTFRPELVAVSNRCYGISHQAKVSSIHLLTKKDALSFVSNLQQEDEGVMPVGRGGGGRGEGERTFEKSKDEDSLILSDDEADENVSVNVSRGSKRAKA